MVAGAWRRSAIVSKSGTSERSSPTSARVSVERAQQVVGACGARDDDRVERARAVAGARGAHGAERLVHALVGRRELVRVHADVELGDVEAEQLDAAAQVGERAVGDARAAVGAQARVHQLEVGEQPGRVVVGRLAVAREQVLEPLADEAQLAPVGLVEVLVADLGCEGRELALVALDRAQQRVAHGHHARRDADRARELAHLDAVARERQAPGAVEPLGHRVRPGLGIAVLVAADPRAEAERRGGVRHLRAIGGEHAGRDVEQRRLEEPQRVTDLVDDARPARAHLVGLPERGDLGRDVVLEPPARRRGESAGSSWASRMRLSCSCACSTVRRAASVGWAVMTSSSETRVRTVHELGRRDAAAGEAAERLRERLARDQLLVLVAAAAAHAVPGLGDVGELEVEPEGAQDGGRALVVEVAHVRSRARRDRSASRIRAPCAPACARARRRPAAPRRPARRARGRARRRPGARRAAGARHGGCRAARRNRRRGWSTFGNSRGAFEAPAAAGSPSARRRYIVTIRATSL